MANKIEGLIVKIKDSSASATGSFSIAKTQIYSNETSLVGIEKYTSPMKTLKAVKDYYEVDGKTYKMVKSMYSQSPSFNNVSGYQYQIVPFNWTDATQSQVKSVEVGVGMFNPINNGSLRIKISGGNSTEIDTKESDKTKAIEKMIKNYEANVFVANENTNTNSVAKANLYNNNENLKCFSGVRNKAGELTGIAQIDAKGKDLIKKYVIYYKNGSYRAIANNVHYMEVNGMDFTGCSDLNDVVDLLNKQGFNCKFELLNEGGKNYIVAKVKSLGSNFTIDIESAISPDVVIDLKNVCFGGPTSATTTTPSLAGNWANIIALGDAKLSINVDGTTSTRYNFDFTSCTTINDVVNELNLGANTTKGTSPVVKTPFAGVVFSAVNQTIMATTTSTGASASVEFAQTTTEATAEVSTKKSKAKVLSADANADEDLYEANYFNCANQIKVAGSDGAITTDGTEGTGDSIVDLYQKYDVYPDFFGSVITTTAKMSINNIYKLNNDLKVSANNGFRVCMVMTLQDPYDVEATDHGVITDWLNTDYLSLYCGGFTGMDDLELRAGVLSIGCGQNVLDSNAVAGSKYDMHMKDIVIEDSSTTDISFTNDMMDLVNSNGVGGCGYFKQGFGWKLTIPSGDNQYTCADMINKHNIAMSFSIVLANALATRKYTNKTDTNIKQIHELLYNQCLILSQNGVLTGDISDFSAIPVNVDEAKKMIQNTDYHAYIYSPAASTISGHIVPITIYFGFANSVYGFELENVYLN